MCGPRIESYCGLWTAVCDTTDSMVMCCVKDAVNCDLSMTVHSVVDSTSSSSPKTAPKKSRKSPTTTQKKLPYECKACTESFRLESQLTDHLYGHIESAVKLESVEMNSVIAVKLFDCTWCSMQFNTSTELTQHLILHGDQRPHVCDCRRRFATCEKLTKHQAVHVKKDRRRGRKPSGGKVQKCTECGKQFSTSKQFVQHLRTHSDQRPFHCMQVSKYFFLPF